jgi:hypothetical protein
MFTPMPKPGLDLDAILGPPTHYFLSLDGRLVYDDKTRTLLMPLRARHAEAEVPVWGDASFTAQVLHTTLAPDPLLDLAQGLMIYWCYEAPRQLALSPAVADLAAQYDTGPVLLVERPPESPTAGQITLVRQGHHYSLDLTTWRYRQIKRGK